MYISIKEESINNININKENIVCLIISSFIFSLLLSLIIDLYSLIPLTPNANIIGIKIIFCNSIDTKIKIIPFIVPITLTIVAIVKPKENPLYKIIPKTIGIPYNCSSKKPY